MKDITPSQRRQAAQIVDFFRKYASVDDLRAARPEILEMARGVNRRTRSSGASGTPARKPKKKATASAADAFQIKITLRGSKPPIWRRVVVPDIRLDHLHEVIQAAMGWSDSHQHQFEIDGEVFCGRTPDGEMLDDEDMPKEAEYELCDVARIKSKFCYRYDFGDNWEHVIRVEKYLPAAEAPQQIVCLAGKGGCPPEDCGGIWGYCDTLAALADPTHPEHESTREWMGEFEPNVFDCKKVSTNLAHLKW
ncbi:MAG: plasmid pRiA4b ORF-3 family protein [Tepidisphaeraceae bacterium]|jgi:hypothetical protein